MRKEKRLFRDAKTWKKNSKEAQSKSSLPLSVVYRLKKIGDEVKERYGRPMDIEFVYQKGTIYIVQARPIPEQNKEKLKPPCSVAPEKLAEVKGKEILYQGSTITSSINYVTLASNENDLLICDNIENALEQYLSGYELRLMSELQNNVPTPKKIYVSYDEKKKEIKYCCLSSQGIVRDTLLLKNLSALSDFDDGKLSNKDLNSFAKIKQHILKKTSEN